MDDGQDTPTKTSGSRAEEETGLTPGRWTETAPGPSTPLPATPTTEEQTPGTLRRLFQTPPRRPRRSRAAAGLETQEPSPLRPFETPPRRPPKRARFITGFGSPSSPTGSGGPSSPVVSDAEPSLASDKSPTPTYSTFNTSPTTFIAQPYMILQESRRLISRRVLRASIVTSPGQRRRRRTTSCNIFFERGLDVHAVQITLDARSR
ncbi:hypothetical protein CKAH01_18183 [Colletotrichum kahawae]|uniref:Uncharacterized protein n=1 Tax=Colletotrichum kahawae TaxID=34407 RepID=A0AAE0D2D4_COLKA|nr:hypothetical protein CKAH01_18183 [Colletotrichum kahawae]